jgi:beta-N-acetylhexosaminidase
MAEMEAVAGAVGRISDAAKARLDLAMATIAEGVQATAFDDLIARRDALMAYLA